ncbi:dTDP-4-dehydrorhamnose reductase [Neisseria shayeganii]|uniref:dTDP-4-dehydrorhamnose reductase n=1 Tax=Neisseria shayeganii TaxID=607712 RepID=A0A7D7S3X7_9NEIS|nr:dTDP-4-dehydrorhamnose reductase [Neisseria shayeganii]QMT39446.1 dTDP-4-dehydrorhamnose reductase [Neisseria shayeganii]
MRILLTGAKGQVGQNLKQQKPEHWEMIAADSTTLDITHDQAVNNMVQNFEPDVIINAAGYTDLEAAEHNKDEVFAVNAEGVRNLAAAAAKHNVRFIHISSDYVFDGQKDSPYTELDYPNPLSTYAKSKLAGELLALAANPDSIIIRSSWVFSEYGSNFVKDIIAQADQETISVVTDKIGCPTYAGDLAKLMIQFAQEPQMTPGIYHFCGDVPVTRYEFAQIILHALEKIRPVKATIQETVSIQIDEQTPRPPYSVLSCEKIRQLGYLPSDWQLALKHLNLFDMNILKNQ